MLRWLIGTSIRARIMVVVLGAGVLVLGVVQLRDMPRDTLPEFTPVQVEVQTEALGLSAEETEQLITVPLEQDMLNGVSFMDNIRSETLPGLSKIVVTFQPGTSLAVARQVVNERLVQAVIGVPVVGSGHQEIQPLSSESRTMLIRLSSKTRSLLDLSTLARWTIRPALLSVPGVANVTAWGQRDEQLQVRVDPAKLHDRGVSLDQIISTTGNSLWASPLTFLEASTPGSGGFFETPTQRLGVQHIQPIKTAKDLAKVVLEPPAGAPGATTSGTRLGDVATVVRDHPLLIGDAVFKDGPGLLLMVEKLPGANTVEVTRALQDKLDELEPGLQGVKANASFYRPAAYIQASDSNLNTALIIGAVLALLALGAYLFNLRTLAVSLASVILALAAAVLVLSMRGETINAMVLAGLVLALVVLVDDAVVSADTIRRDLVRAQGDDAEVATTRRFLGATVAVRRPLLYATVIAVLALTPIFVLTGETGAFLPPLAFSYGAAVVASLVVALTVTPALAMLLLPRKRRAPRMSPLERWLQPRGARLVDRLVRTPGPGLIAGIVLVVIAVGLLPVLHRNSSLVPAFQDRDLVVQLTGAPGTSLTETDRVAARMSRELSTLDGVDTVAGHVGRAVLGDRTVDASSGELWVKIKSSADYDNTVSSIERVARGYPGLQSSVLTYPKERINAVLRTPDGMAGKDLTVRVFGENLNVLQRQARKLSARLAKIDGVTAPRVETPVEEPALQVNVDIDKARALGIKPGDVRRGAATVLSGLRVGFLFQQQKVFDVVVWGTPATRNSVSNVDGVLIDRPDGQGTVRLGDVATVKMVPSPTVIKRRDSSRAIDIGLDVSGRGTGAVATDVRDVLRSEAFPLQYHAELLNDYADKQSDKLLFIGLCLAAVLGIFLILQAALRSWLLAALLLVLLPGALAGGVVAALINGNLVSLGTLVGFLAVLALAVRQSVVLLNRCQERKHEAGDTMSPELVRAALRERLAPVGLTAISIALVFLPFLLMGDVAGTEVVEPMAAVIIGGLVTAVAFSLAVVPALYLRFGAYRGEDPDMFADLTVTGFDEDVDPDEDAARLAATVD
jgi:Cu/Ag efflux pump CusA